MFEKIPQLQSFTSILRIDRIVFDDDFKRIMVDAVFSEDSGINTNDIPPTIEDSWSDTTSFKDREIGNTFIGIARAIFESDKIDEGMQTLKDKATELRDTHGEDLRDATLSLFKKLRYPENEQTPNDNSRTYKE